MNHIRIAMWSGPRNISTALMRSFENRADTTVMDEPFYGYYLKTTKFDHPMKEQVLASQNINWDNVVDLCSNKIFKGYLIIYQKHMSHHLMMDNDLSWLNNMKNCILIRNPKYVINSYIKKYNIEDVNQLGYIQQLRIVSYIKKYNFEDPVILDASDILDNPKRALKKICKKLDISFTNQMLYWPKGSRETDGVWAKHWYKNVINSTGFIKPKEKKINIDRQLYDIYKKCMKHYEVLYDKRLKL